MPLAQSLLSLFAATSLTKTGFSGLWKAFAPFLKNCFLPNAFFKGSLVERGFV